MAEQTKTRMTADEFRQLPETLQPTELINGELIVSPSPKFFHQNVATKLSGLLLRVVDKGTVISAPMDVYIDEINAVQPDIFWFTGDGQCKLREDNYLYGAPELVVEVLSPSTSTRDKREKYSLYERYGSLEYWLVDLEGEHIEVYQRQDDTFQRVGIFTDGDELASLALGKTIQFDGIFDIPE